jgi:curved DNA-binding protein
MAFEEPFVDLYAILEASPTCSARALEEAYHALAKRYHPDHAEEADVRKFTDVVSAYKALKDPEDRAKYDLHYAELTGFEFNIPNDEMADERAAGSDADAHAKILQYLYKRRRENAQDAGVGRYLIQDMLKCSDELFDFHTWYLKEKGLIMLTEHGTFAITIMGVDHVISASRTAIREKLLLEELSGTPKPEQS